MSEIKVDSVRTEVELDAAVGVWRQANIARGAPHGPERTARIRAKLSASDALPFVALRPRSSAWRWPSPDGSTAVRANSIHRFCTSRWFSSIPPHNAQESAFPYSVMSLTWPTRLGYQRLGVWTAEENTPARRLYERAGMTLSGKSARVLSRTHLQYEFPLQR